MNFVYNSDSQYLDDPDDDNDDDDDVPVPAVHDEREAEVTKRRRRKVPLKKKLVHNLESASTPSNYDPYVPPTTKVECSAVLEKGDKNNEAVKINWVNQPPSKKQQRGRKPANMIPHELSE